MWIATLLYVQGMDLICSQTMDREWLDIGIQFVHASWRCKTGVLYTVALETDREQVAVADRLQVYDGHSSKVYVLEQGMDAADYLERPA
jgi:hypothetical protein